MAEFLTTQGTLDRLENIIKDAKNRLVLISPYLQLPKTLFERLKDADRRNVKITLIYGKDRLKPDERSRLKQLNNLSLYFLTNLHAKCYFNEECMVITSMNMYDVSAKNREMGVLIREKDDNEVFNKAVNEMDSIVHASTKDDLRKSKEDAPHSRNKQMGYCIRCKRPIPYDLDKPHCYECFLEWKAGPYIDYPERYCHICGRREETTKEKPQCRSCYMKSRR
ncbi:unnamed protein product [marine sediment metagenome]|uniref:Phospholipase D-like domain-containing protein n=1 Tax=marine sediment metagenome TaxID=412755 RepID=X1BDQ7_9ZZZZ